MPKLGVTMPGLNQPIEAFPIMASAAEDAGFDSVWNYEFHRNPFVVHALTAKATSRITLGTGLAAAAGRSPFEMANAAADVDEVSQGRTALGMSMGAFGWSELLNGVDISHPASRMREYIELLHRVWDWTAGIGVGPYEGRFYRFSEPQFNPFGQRPLARPHIPIYLGALRPTMARLGGQIADGVLGYFMPPQYIRDVILPNVAAGARKVGRDPQDVDVASETVCSVSDDRAEAYRRARLQVGIYIAAELSAPMADYMGKTKERLMCVEALMTQGPMGLIDVVDDDLVDTFSITGTPDECRRKLKEFDDCLPHVILHPPYMPVLSTEESADAFNNIVEAFDR